MDDWLESKAITAKDKAAIDSVIEAVETVTGGLFPPEKVKKYKGTDLYEVKAKGPGKQLRPLAHMDGKNKQLILLCGAIEKDDELDSGDVKTAENLAQDWKDNKGSVKDYWED
jgi:hypothetical protein